jgi:hypothetical protein
LPTATHLSLFLALPRSTSTGACHRSNGRHGQDCRRRRSPLRILLPFHHLCHHSRPAVPYAVRALAQVGSRWGHASVAIEADRRGRKQPVLMAGSPWPISSHVKTLPGCAISRGISCAPSPVAQPPEHRRRWHCPHGAARARGQQATDHLGPYCRCLWTRLAALALSHHFPVVADDLTGQRWPAGKPPLPPVFPVNGGSRHLSFLSVSLSLSD